MGRLTTKKALSASLKIIFPLYTTYFLIAMSIFFVFVPMEKGHMMDQKKEMIHSLVDMTAHLLKEYDQQVKQGEITLETAQDRALKQIQNLRYGPDAKSYFWIIDYQHRVIMHPYMPELEGTDQTDIRDSEGKQLYAAMVETVKNQGGGYVDYYWQWQDDPGKIVPKISYVEGFLPWGWVVGTGIYVDDIQEEIKQVIHKFIRLFAGVLAVIIFLSFYIAGQAVRIQKKRNLAENARYLEELRLKTLLELSRMSDVSLNHLTEFALEEAIKLTRSDIGYLAFLNEDETQVTLHAWSGHGMEKNDIIDHPFVFSVEKTGVWCEAVRSREALIINNYETFESSKKKGYPQGHMKILRYMSVPVFDGEKIVALAGVGNKTEAYDESDVRQLKLMMDGMWKIIQRKRSEDSLRENEERYRLLADNATDNIWVLALSNLKFIYTSPSVERLLGYTPEEFIGLEMGQNMTEDSLRHVMTIIKEEMVRETEEGVDTGRHREIELELTRKDGSKIWTEATASFLRDQEGKPDRVLGITRNIDERKHLEKRLLQAQKMEALGTLAGGIAHDFNNILSSVLGFTELAKLDVSADGEVRKNLDQVMAAGIRARDLVKHILTFSRRADVQKNLIGITPLIKECLKFLRASVPTNIEIRHELHTDAGIVMADPTQIHQVLMNLFTNAAHAMKQKGGILDVRLTSIMIQDNETFKVKELTQGRYLQLTVADTGCGIPKQVIPKIFEPFFTTKGRGEGTGMGLSSAFGIIKDIGGMIFVQSEPDVGTTFQVMFPQQQGEPLIGEASADFLLVEGKGRILLIDDETSIVDWMKQVLLKLGYEVLGMEDSQAAFELFKQNPGDFDLVITDLAMPQMTGLELSEKVMELRPDIPIILCTGFGEGVTPETIKTYGISDMVMKPMISSELARSVSIALNKEMG